MSSHCIDWKPSAGDLRTASGKVVTSSPLPALTFRMGWHRPDARKVASDLRQIYTSATSEEASRQLEIFAATRDATHPTISEVWRRNWERITPFFAFLNEIRKVIHTTNAVESLHMSLRKIIKTRGSFPNEEAAIRLLYLALRNHSKKGSFVQGWREALNRFQILWPDRMPALERS